ncbi:hypothetical protein [Falsihalocynthiibacter arcticus]|uniref:hypothetical protein n=1 Tax=Falsihalocynthiibacter arcticus TaxID=1579316 RepID=UPI0030020799
MHPYILNRNHLTHRMNAAVVHPSQGTRSGRGLAALVAFGHPKLEAAQNDRGIAGNG